MRALAARYWITALLALPIGYGLGVLAFVWIADDDALGFQGMHAWGIPGLAIGAVAIIGALAAIAVADHHLDRSVTFRMLWGGLGAGAAILMACLMAATLSGFASGIFALYFAVFLALPAGFTAAILIGLSDAAAAIAGRRRIWIA